MHLELLQTKQFKKQQKQPVNWLVIKMQINNKGLKDITAETVPSETEAKGFDVKIPKERYTCPEKDSKLLMSWNKYSNIIIEYQKIIIFLYNKVTQPSKFRTKNWVEVIDDLRGMINIISQIKFKNAMLKSD